MKKLLGILAVGAGAAALTAYYMRKDKKEDAEDLVEEVADVLKQETENASTLVKEVVEEGLHDEEQIKLRTLCEEGYQALLNDNDNRKERPLQHMITFTCQDDLEHFKEAVILDGYVVTTGSNDLELYVLNISKIDFDAICHSVFHLAKIAQTYHGVYDHWIMK